MLKRSLPARLIKFFTYSLILFNSTAIVFADNHDGDNFAQEYQDYLGKTPNTGEVKSFELVAAAGALAVAGDRKIPMWSYNGSIPGPVLRARQGDIVRIHFTNRLPQDTTIHWHGMRVPNAMDGVPMVTQKPVKPGASFIYEFQLQDAGTYWFHPHVRSHEQIERGLYGVFIVESADDPIYDDEWIWVLDDWLLSDKKSDKGQIEESFSKGDLSSSGRLGNVLTVNAQRIPTFTAKAGSRVRVRVINAANARNFRLKLPGINTRVIAVDGNPVGAAPLLERFDIAPGNRVDIDLSIPEQASDTVFAIENTFFHREAKGRILSGPERLAQIAIAGKIDKQKTFSPPLSQSVPRWDGALDTPIQHTFDFNSRLNIDSWFRGGPLVEFVINGKKYKQHEVSQLKLGSYSHIKITNGTGLYHPIHFHGMFFKVLSRNGKAVDEAYFRDTVLLDYDGSIEIGLIPLDAGAWMMHCHLLEHSALGMMTVVNVAEQ